MRIGYLVSQYPAASHTFIRREIDELRLRGINVQTFSVRPPEPNECRSERDYSAFQQTFYVLPVSVMALVAAHFAAIFTRPAAYFCVAALAFRHRAPVCSGGPFGRSSISQRASSWHASSSGGR